LVIAMLCQDVVAATVAPTSISAAVKA